jgi:hypothetical protein
MIMNKKAMILAAGALAAAALVLGGWFEYQHLEGQVSSGTVLRGYNPRDPATTAPHTENVFTGRVTEFEEKRDIKGWTQDVYRVEVISTLRGNLRGTVRATYGLDEGSPDRLADGSTYIFATHAWTDATNDGHAQLYQGEMKPVDDAQLAVWKKAVALPTKPDQ